MWDYKVRPTAEAHWKWVEGLLKSMGVPNEQMPTLKYLYVEAFVHGAKHAEQPRDAKGHFLKESPYG